MRKIIVDLGVAVALLASAHADANSLAKPQSRSGWQTLDDCHYVTNASNDGDSFHVTCKGKAYLFRLYFVDTPETETSLVERIDPFDAFFHPDGVAQASQPTKPNDSFDAFFHPATPAPAPSAAIARSTSAPSLGVSSNKLDVNSATPEQLEQLPGIGETLVQRIIAPGPFKSADDLRHVKGIGDTRDEKVRPYFN